jgi:hypothetical protein
MTNNVDCLPLGDIPGYLILLFIANPELQIKFLYKIDDQEFTVSTKELADEGITNLQNAEISAAVKSYIQENFAELNRFRKEKSFLC